MSRLFLIFIAATAGCSSTLVSEGSPRIETQEQCASLISQYDNKIEATTKADELASSAASRSPTPDNQAKAHQALQDMVAATADRAAVMGACKAAGLLD